MGEESPRKKEERRRTHLFANGAPEVASGYRPIQTDPSEDPLLQAFEPPFSIRHSTAFS
jgi:hypothetical protein